jgi:hypothetical protein
MTNLQSLIEKLKQADAKRTQGSGSIARFNSEFACLAANSLPKLLAIIEKQQKALQEIDEWWDSSDPTRVIPAKKENELCRNDSMAASAIIMAKETLAEIQAIAGGE